MDLTLLAGRSNPALAKATAGELGIRLASAQVFSFPDGELHVQIEESLRGHYVYILQSTSPPAAAAAAPPPRGPRRPPPRRLGGGGGGSSGGGAPPRGGPPGPGGGGRPPF